jgi:hypothetical protein
MRENRVNKNLNEGICAKDIKLSKKPSEPEN